MTNDETYQAYATDPIGKVPKEDAKYLINMFMKEAAINMGSAVDEQTLERSIFHVLTDYGFLPTSYVASAFVRGSLGNFGAGRLVPRTIHSWLYETSAEFNRMMAKEKQKDVGIIPETTFDLHRLPIGKAIMKKVDWYNAGLLVGDEWDKISLKELAEALGKGRQVSFNEFYHEN